MKLQNQSILNKMSTTRSQKRRNNSQDNPENVSEVIIPTSVQVNTDLNEQDILIAGPSSAKSPRIENSALEELRASLKDEITSEIKGLLAESHKDLLKLLKHKSNESIRSQDENHPENESREFHTPTRSVRINSTSNDDATASRNSIAHARHNQKEPNFDNNGSHIEL